MAKNTKEHILEIAQVLFLRKSFNAVSMNDIVKKAGVTKGAFYHHFESKEALLRAVLKSYFFNAEANDEHQFDQFDQSSLKTFYQQFMEDNFKRMRSFHNQIGLSPDDKPFNRFLLVFDGMNHNPQFRKHFNDHNQLELKIWKKVIANAKKTGEIKSQIANEKIAKMFMMIGDGFGLHTILKNKKISELKEAHQEAISLYDGLYQLLK